MGAASLPDSAWHGPALKPCTPADYEALRAEPRSRHIALDRGEVYVDSDPLSLTPAEYWQHYEEIAFEALAWEDDAQELYDPHLPARLPCPGGLPDPGP